MGHKYIALKAETAYKNIVFYPDLHQVERKPLITQPSTLTLHFFLFW